MTKQEMKKAVIKAVKDGMDEKIRNIYVDLDHANDTVIKVGIIYGKYGIDMVKLSLQRLHNSSGAYQIYGIEGHVNIYHIKGINTELKLIEVA